MVPKDNAFSNVGVVNRLVVRETISAPVVIVQQSIVLAPEATITRESSSGAPSQSNVVFTTGDQTIDGVKTFLQAPIFPNGGGGTGTAPNSLTYYEEFKGTADFESKTFVGTQSMDMLITRIGNSVTMRLSGFNVASTGVSDVIETKTPIPERFMPSVVTPSPGNSYQTIRVIDNFAFILGMFTVTSAGLFTVSRANNVGANVNLVTSAFSGVGTVGFFAFTMNWIV